MSNAYRVTSIYPNELVERFCIKSALRRDDEADLVLLTLYEQVRGQITCSEFTGSTKSSCNKPGSLARGKHTGKNKYFQASCKGCSKSSGWGAQYKKGRTLAQIVWDTSNDEAKEIVLTSSLKTRKVNSNGEEMAEIRAENGKKIIVTKQFQKLLKIDGSSGTRMEDTGEAGADGYGGLGKRMTEGTPSDVDTTTVTLDGQSHLDALMDISDTEDKDVEDYNNDEQCQSISEVKEDFDMEKEETENPCSQESQYELSLASSQEELPVETGAMAKNSCEDEGMF